jgi:hypothetical protein
MRRDVVADDPNLVNLVGRDVHPEFARADVVTEDDPGARREGLPVRRQWPPPDEPAAGDPEAVPPRFRRMRGDEQPRP